MLFIIRTTLLKYKQTYLMSLSETTTVKFKKLHPNAIIPTKGTPLSAGFDLYALEDKLIIGGAGNFIVPTGIAVQLPPGTYGRIAMRSGLAVNQHLTVSGGVIDVDYTGPIGVIVTSTKIYNIDPSLYGRLSSYGAESFLELHSYQIKKGERFAQLIVEKCDYSARIEVVQKNDADHTVSAHAGWGSTGNN